MTDKIATLENENTLLKARLFDFTELLGSKEQELALHRNLLTEVCQLLELDGSQGVSPEAVIGAISALLPGPTESPVDSDDAEK